MAQSASEIAAFAPDAGGAARQSQRLSAAPPFTRVAAYANPADADAAWAALEASAPASAYQTRRWVIPWIETVARAERIRPLIIVAYDGANTPVALLPLGIVNRGPLRLAEFLGGKDANFTFGLFARHVAFPRADLAALLREAGRASPERIDAFALVNQPESWNGAANPMLALAHQPAPSFGFKSALIANCEAYVENHMSSESRKKQRKKERRLAQAGKLAYVTARDAATAKKILDAFAQQKAARMSAMGVRNVFADTSHSQFLARACLENLETGGNAIELHALMLDDRVIATFGGAVHQGRFCGMFNSFDLSPEIARSSPGDLLLMWLVREKCRGGLAIFDLGVGEARYKEAFCDVPEPLFDCHAGLTLAGYGLARAKSAKRSLKRAVKTNPRLWALAARLRKAFA